MSSGMDVSGVASAMDPDSLQYVLEQFPLVVFKSIPWDNLPACQNCPDGLGCEPQFCEAIVQYRRWLPEQDAYSQLHSWRACGGCLSGVLRDVQRWKYTDVTVEVLGMWEAI